MSIQDVLTNKFGALMRTRDVSEVLGCHPSHVRALCQNGKLPAIQIGKRWFIVTARFAAMLEGSTNATV